MVAIPLSDNQVAAGQALLERLDDQGVRVDAALWFYFSDKENWKLVLSLPDVIRQGPKAAYTEVQRVLSEAGSAIGIKLVDVAIARPNSGPLNLFRGVIRTKPGAKTQTRFTRCVFHGQLVEDALVYRLLHSGNGVRAKKKA